MQIQHPTASLIARASTAQVSHQQSFWAFFVSSGSGLFYLWADFGYSFRLQLKDKMLTTSVIIFEICIRGFEYSKVGMQLCAPIFWNVSKNRNSFFLSIKVGSGAGSRNWVKLLAPGLAVKTHLRAAVIQMPSLKISIRIQKTLNLDQDPSYFLRQYGEKKLTLLQNYKIFTWK